ncbi:F-box domain-containing protein [Heracleum sosnowskyi]|uniref:F-box domain-containing protein n=1 Tax=Heracleum sosnowskyi TaxID=360622 RepID=A0AAD8H615_9APIA|nr:F-box domain-containing protein [Heracleum sosnowskyi]
MNHQRKTKKAKKIIAYEKGNMVTEHPFPILELPILVLYVIISKLPLRTIFSCKGVCRALLKLIEDPYFARIHLNEALNTSNTIIVNENHFLPPLNSPSSYFRPHIIDLDYSPKKSSCSSDHHFYNQHIICSQSGRVALRAVKCCFLEGNAVLVSSCNGLLCLYSPSLKKKPTYCICNPVIGECMTLPHPTFTSNYTYLNHSGFGFCPNTEQYKVLRFMSSALTLRTVALVHTLGTGSWRNIGEAPCPKSQLCFDSFLDGKLHLITDSPKISDKIYSFDLETEKFEPVPVPAHFSPEYFSKISWISVGVVSGCLCLCYTSSDAYFEVFAMEEYGIVESWIKKFAIDIKFYCGLRTVDLRRPIKFLNNGELLFLYKFNSLVSYSPQKGTFRDIKSLGNGRAEAIAHVSSFMSLKNHVFERSIKSEKIKLERPTVVQNVSSIVDDSSVSS